MKRHFKIVALIILFLISAVIIRNIYIRRVFQQEYVKELKQQKNKCITSFYKSDFNGTISHIKRGEENPTQYVISIKTPDRTERTIGKVEITNFSGVKQGDLIRKRPNTFELEISNTQGKVLSIVKYQ